MMVRRGLGASRFRRLVGRSITEVCRTLQRKPVRRRSGQPRRHRHGREFWVSGVKKTGEDGHWAGKGAVEVDDDARGEYERLIANRRLGLVANGPFTRRLPSTSVRPFAECVSRPRQRRHGRNRRNVGHSRHRRHIGHGRHRRNTRNRPNGSAARPPQPCDDIAVVVSERAIPEGPHVSTSVRMNVLLSFDQTQACAVQVQKPAPLRVQPANNSPVGIEERIH